jgi:hypothetical protein
LTELLRLSMANDYNERHQCHNESHQRYLTNISAFTKSDGLACLVSPDESRHHGASVTIGGGVRDHGGSPASRRAAPPLSPQVASAKEVAATRATKAAMNVRCNVGFPRVDRL